MSYPGVPGRGRHASEDEDRRARSRHRETDQPYRAEDAPGWPAAAPSWEATSSFWEGRDEAADRGAWRSVPASAERSYRTARVADTGEWATGGMRRASGLLERYPGGGDETGPMPQWRHRPGGGDPPSSDRHSGRDDRAPAHPADDGAAGRHPSSPLPPMPRSVWSKLQPRADRQADEPTAAGTPPELPDELGHDEQWHDEQWHDEQSDDEQWDDEQWNDGPGAEGAAGSAPSTADADTEAHAVVPQDEWDLTGGLEVIGAHVEEERRRGWFHRSRHPRTDVLPAEPRPASDVDPRDERHPAGADDADIPIAPYDPRPQRRRTRRKRVALVVCLVVLAGLVGGIVVGGQKIWGMFASQDYTGPGTGSVRIRVHDGDTLTDIGKTMVADDVIASVRPFVKAAEANPAATTIAPGLYGLRHHMSGKAALARLLQPSSRLVSHVTIPEGMTVAKMLQRLADGTGVPIAQLQAAAAAPQTLGLPPYANGSLEGFLFPATYDFEPGTTATQMLAAMVKRAVQTLDELQIPADQRLAVVTKASIVQAESGSAEDMPKVARVIDNRLAAGMLLQLDTTVNYANGKAGVTTTAQDRQNPSPYNTYLHPGLPPGPISNPGEQALRAVLAPAPGNWLYFVVVNPDTGETRFAATAEEHQQNVALFQQWLRAHPGG